MAFLSMRLVAFEPLGVSSLFEWLLFVRIIVECCQPTTMKMNPASSNSSQLHTVTCNAKSDERGSITNMGQGSSTPAPVEEKPKKKLGIKTGKPICCCCPDTKTPRDECIVQKGEDDPECQKLIELHKQCLREEGFDVN